MIKQQEKKKFNLFSIFICLLMFLIPFCNNYSCFATNDTYSNVLEDLKKDTNFNEENYPVIENDFSLHLIQIAEGVNKELFIYVYQPSLNKNLIATSINISTGIDDKLDYKNYKLELLNSENVFYKFKVLNFEIKADTTRYYDITSIFRAWQEDIDEPAEGDNTISEVSFAVNSLWIAQTENNKTSYKCLDIETIEITDKYVGFVRYKDGFNLWPTSCDSHFVAFSTDRPISKLKEADVYFTKQEYRYYDYVGGKSEYYWNDAVLENYVHLTYKDKGSFSQDGLFSRTYEWDRIVRTSTFLKDSNINDVYSCGIIDLKFGSHLTDESKEYLSNKDWVLRFAETDYSVTYHSSSSYYVHKGTLVGDVTILRLKFETFGKTYNLGVIDNKQTGDGKPDNVNTIGADWPWWLKLLIIIACVIVLSIWAPWIIQFLFKIIWWVLKAVWWLISAPFYIFKK